ncbi:MAG: hypothetical protein [Caudoviricetes sp.]|nr:MAG: hypothetical protein [Caudoviricetes sp.]
MAKFYPISYSGLKLYEGCPYSFYRQKIFEPKIKDTDLKPALQRGIQIHKVLEDFVRKGEKIPDDYPQLIPVAGAITMFKEKNAGAKLEAERSLYIDENYEAIKNKSSFESFFSSFINAKIDLTVTVGNFAFIKDYKTGKSKGDQAQLDMQAGCLFANAPNLTHIKTQFVYVDTNSYSHEVMHTRDTVWNKALKDRIDNYVYGLQKDIFPKRSTMPSFKDPTQQVDNSMCKFCPVTECEFNKRGSHG